MNNDDFLKGLEKDIKKEIELGLQEELRCKCGYKFTDITRKLQIEPTLVCPRCGGKTTVSVSVKKGR